MASKLAGTQYYHMFQAMRISGDVAEMGPHAFTLYSMIKSYVSMDEPDAFPSIDTLIQDTGMSKSTIIRSIQKLVEMGYLSKQLVGRNTVYRVVERIQVLDDAGDVQAVASWEYVPKHAVNAISELKELFKQGLRNGSDAHYIHVEHLQVVVAQLGEGATMNNFNGDTVQQQAVEPFKEATPSGTHFVIDPTTIK